MKGGRILAAETIFDKDAAKILADCTHTERKIIIGTMQALKDNLRAMR